MSVPGPEVLAKYAVVGMTSAARRAPIDDLTAHALRMAELAQTVDDLTRSLRARVAATRWRGGAASACVDETQECLAQLARLAERYASLAGTVRAASSSLAGGPAATGAGPLEPPLGIR